MANAIHSIWTQRFAAPTAIVMHPRRWAALLGMLDANNRPLFLPEANHPMNAAGILENVEPQNLVGRALGLPIFTDATTTTTATEAQSADEDVIYVLRAQDVVRLRIRDQSQGLARASGTRRDGARAAIRLLRLCRPVPGQRRRDFRSYAARVRLIGPLVTVPIGRVHCERRGWRDPRS